MFEKLKKIKARYLELERQIADPAVIARQDEWKKLTKEHSELADTVEVYDSYTAAETELETLKAERQSERDGELCALLDEEISSCNSNLSALTDRLKEQLLPKDPDDSKNVVLEIRAGAGGDEAGLFGYELLKMYLRYAERNRWRVEEVDTSLSDIGGIKEAVVLIGGRNAYSKLKFESGVHRVQRVPATESQGRVHTSTVTVAVLPEADDIEIHIEEKDLRIDTYRSSGAGGQHVNKTESAIRITHLPTGMVVQCQDEKSQIKNRERALKVLKSRLYDYYAGQAEAKYAQNRKQLVGTGDRSERIRTYNFPQGRITDHRINMTVYSLESYMQGEIDEMVEALTAADRDLRLSGKND